MFEGLELVDEASLNRTDTLHTWLLVLSHPGGRRASRNLAGTPFRQGPSTLCGSHICLHVSLPTAPVLPPGDALQFHTVWPSPVQHVIDELVEGGPTGYFFRFFLLLRKLPCLEESDSMLCPCQRLGLDGKDQRHFLSHGRGCLHGQGLTPCRSQLSFGRLSVRSSTLAGSPRGSVGKYLPGPDFLRLFYPVDGSMDG